MGKSKASMVVADATDADLELEYQQHQILEQLNGFHDSVSLLATRQESFQSNLMDIQASLTNISLFQNHLMEEIRASKQPQPSTNLSPHIPIGSLQIPLGSSFYPAPLTLPTSSTLFCASSSHVGYPFHPFPLYPILSTPLSTYPPSPIFPSTTATTLRPHPQPTSFPMHPIPPYIPRSLPATTGPKHMKIKLSRFSGDDPYSWLALAEEYMDYHGVDAAHWVTIVWLYFIGDAALWFKWYKLHIGSGLWATFTESLLQRFGPGDQLDFNMFFSHVLQKGSLDDYINDFIRLSCRAQGWSDPQLLEVFIGGLKI